ncbi:NAD(P)-dependent oxidoreductase [Hymenobacter properus]|uniref:NAD(P)-dependent oxidoreductase n=1 Tax=Hymenobacter properus TaxID=2791026 RepID=A0A931BD54_9BACT|nr:NAD(P)-dependent oxidoreductase [Hymenobacter properus]MBF9141680.1 NAD(P)-dependent oxidoreductase [Hymenobacter properus]MBR7720489.1 NAD(P)-dependent oxidoreductase [Microvirga sp. SRT04]
METTTTTGWIGLGNMGTPMARRLLAAGLPVTAYNRNPAKAEALRADGATVAPTPAAVLDAAQVIFLMVSDDQAIRELFTWEHGLLQSATTGKLLVNMSTVSPGVSQEMAKLSRAKGHQYLDAPVSGSVKQAESGQLAIMVGGEEEAFKQAEPLFAHLGKLALRVGSTGSGNTAKLAMNTMLGFQAQGLAEAVLFAQQHGLETADLLALIKSSALASIFINLKGEAILNENYQAAFALKLLAKDLRLAKAEGSNTPLANVVHQTFQEAEPAHGEEDVIAILKHLKQE